MGRMADARKRAQRKAGGGGAAGEPPAPEAPAEQVLPAEAPAAGREAEPASESESWVSREEPLVFPAEDEPARSPRISLPSSGTAEEILARADAAAVEARSHALTPIEPLAAPAAPSSLDAPGSRTHNISFFAAPARDERTAVEATEHLVTFLLAREEYGIDVRAVSEIIRVTDITQVPRAPEFIKGVINLRGKIIPVLDLKRRLGLGEVEHTRLARIVVVKLRDRLTGLLVDGASQVLKVPVASIEPAPEEVVEIDANYIRGVAKLETRLIILVDLQKILAVEGREGAGMAPAS
jgi:purine-binding chemotaxis protein CheW